MRTRNYETVFILTPVLSDVQMKDAVDRFKQVLQDNDTKMVNEESWGLKKLAYPINHKSTGFYTLFEYAGSPEVVAKLETEFRRDERVMRFLTIALDKHALAYNEKRRGGAFNKKKEEPKEERGEKK